MRTSKLRKMGGWLASATGYPSVVQRAINLAPMRDDLTIAGSATVERGARLSGTITIDPNALVRSGSVLRGDVFLEEGANVGPNCLIRGTPKSRLPSSQRKESPSVVLSTGASIGSGSRLNGQITIGERSNIMRDLEIIGDNISLGKYNSIARQISFLNRSHMINKPSVQSRIYEEIFDESDLYESKGPLSVGHDVWVGMRSIFLTGVSVGSGAIVGAGSVVTNDVNPYEIVAGTPAEHIGWRFDQKTRESLLDISWWDWSQEKIASNKHFFNTDLETVSNIRELIEHAV